MQRVWGSSTKTHYINSLLLLNEENYYNNKANISCTGIRINYDIDSEYFFFIKLYVNIASSPWFGHRESPTPIMDYTTAAALLLL